MSVAVTRARRARARRGSSARRPATPPRRLRPTPRAPGIEAVIVVAAGAAASSKLVQVRAVGAPDRRGRRLVLRRLRRSGAARRGATGRARQLGGTTTASKARRPRRSRSSSSSAACPTCSTLPYGGGGNTRAYARGFDEAAGDAAALPSRREAASRADTHRVGDPHRRPEPPRRGRGSRSSAPAARSSRSPTTRSSGRVAAARPRGGRLLRAARRPRESRRSPQAAHSRASASSASSPATGSRIRTRSEARGMTIHVRAPATSANSAPASTSPPSRSTSGTRSRSARRTGRPSTSRISAMRAFSRYASPAEWSFTLHRPDPARARPRLERRGRRARPRRGRDRGRQGSRSPTSCSRQDSTLEGHADNLAAALVGGVCLTWDGHIARVADDVPAAAIARRPAGAREDGGGARIAAAGGARTPTPSSARSTRRCSARRSRPATRGSSPRAPATACTSRTARCTRRHLAAIRDDLPAGALGATLSGSGPTVIVWAEKAARGRRRRGSSSHRFPDHEVLHLSVTTTGAGPA